MRHRNVAERAVRGGQALCRGCHIWRTQNPSAAVLEGFACPGWADPAFWPAWREDVRSWVLYLNEPRALTLLQRHGARTPVNSSEARVEPRAGKGTMLVAVVLDDDVIGVE